MATLRWQRMSGIFDRTREDYRVTNMPAALQGWGLAIHKFKQWGDGYHINLWAPTAQEMAQLGGREQQGKFKSLADAKNVAELIVQDLLFRHTKLSPSPFRSVHR